MIVSPAFAGKSYAVLGLARSGLATVEALVASGANVMAWDEREEARSKILPGTGRGTARSAVEGLAPASEQPHHHPKAGPPPRTGEDMVRIADPMQNSLHGLDGVVVSPGVPLNTHPIAARAREAKVPVIGDIELFAQARSTLPPHKVVGITGTNGKSTTTALIHHLLKTAGVPTMMGGNIGLPILGQEPLPDGGVYVLELSSYQIDLTQSLDCDVAVLLNITPDHLDRYESFEAYAASKGRLFEMQSEGHRHVVNPVDTNVSDLVVDNLQVKDGQVPRLQRSKVYGFFASDHEWDQPNWPSLQGPHNAENAAAAALVCRLLNIDDLSVQRGLRTYPGLPHRMERVGERNGVLFVNDSKATNPDSTAPALAAYPSVHWILGGLAKSNELDACEPYLDHVRAAYTIGEAGPMFAQLLAPKVPVSECGVLAKAVGAAAKAAEPGEVVLLSPACASFDQFRDYEARGDAFRAAVEALQ